MHRFGVAILVIGLACGAAWSPSGLGQLPAEIRNMMGDRKLPDDALGAIVVRLTDGKIVFAHGADKTFQPASTLKVLTAIVGLERLGPAYRSRTELRSSAAVENGVLKGDLILRGLGNTDFNWEDLQRMLGSVRYQGITDIAGNLIVDRGFFQPGRIDVGQPPFDEAPEFRYNVIPDAMLINTNLLQLDIASDGLGFTIRQTPPLDRVTIISNMTFVDRPCAKWEDGWQIPSTISADNGDIRVYLNGTFPKNCAQTLHLNVLDRADYVNRLFRSLWRDMAGKFRGEVRESDAPLMVDDAQSPTQRLLAEHRARPLAEVTRNINKSSDNTITRTIFLTLGTMAKPAELAVESPPAPTLDKAQSEIRGWLKQHGISDAELVLENGSGLSRIERIKPSQLAAILQAAYRSKWAPEFMSSLPIVAVDGSMRNRLHASPAAEFGRIKTGGLRNVVAVAGYMPDSAGEQHVVVAMLNHEDVVRAGGRAILDALLDWVAKSAGHAVSAAAISTK